METKHYSWYSWYYRIGDHMFTAGQNFPNSITALGHYIQPLGPLSSGSEGIPRYTTRRHAPAVAHDALIGAVLVLPLAIGDRGVGAALADA